jgi:MerR family transcriptional regulator/heat shock protein HspR
MKSVSLAMEKKYFSTTEIMEIFQVDEDLIILLEQEDIICPECSGDESLKHFSQNEIEKLRIAKTLIEDMDVNIPGVEVILRMRESMINMRRQFDDILEDLSIQIKKTYQPK